MSMILVVYEDRYNQLGEKSMETETNTNVENTTRNHLIDTAVSSMTEDISHYYSEITNLLRSMETYVFGGQFEEANSVKKQLEDLFKEWSDWYVVEFPTPPKISFDQQESDTIVYQWLYGKFAMLSAEIDKMNAISTLKMENESLADTVNDLTIKKMSMEKTILENNLKYTTNKLHDAESNLNMTIGLGIVSTAIAAGAITYTLFNK